MEKSPHFKPGQCCLLLIDHQVRVGVRLTSAKTMVAERAGNRATPQSAALGRFLPADPPMLAVY